MLSIWLSLAVVAAEAWVAVAVLVVIVHPSVESLQVVVHLLSHGWTLLLVRTRLRLVLEVLLA